MKDTTIVKQEIIDIYKILLEQENSNHTIFISVLMGISAIILGATCWWNKTGANSFIKSCVANEMQNKNTELLNLINTKIDKAIDKQFNSIEHKFQGLELDMYRSFAYSLDIDKMYSHSTYYWTKSLEKAIDLDEGELVRAFTETISENLVDIESKEIHQLEEVIEVIKKLPDVLMKEKKEILKILADCKSI